MKTTRKLLSVLLAVLMLATTMAVAAVPVSAVSVGDTFQFGNYPQTKVTETMALKNAANNATWKSYGYYIGTGSMEGGINMYSSNFMRFADFFSGGVKYRAVKFIQYRPCRTDLPSSEENSLQPVNGYYTNTTYYFKYEPLIWRVLDPSTGLILCDRIIDAQAFQNLVWKNGDGWAIMSPKDATNPTQQEWVYPNSYAYSSIINWLNNDFYNTAFNDEQKAKIKTTTTNNSDVVPWWGGSPNEPSTTRPIFLLSYSEIDNDSYGLYSAPTYAIRAKGTDYALCQGLWVDKKYSGTFGFGYSSWMLRTHGNDSSWQTCRVGSTGEMVSYSPTSTQDGVRPACQLSELTPGTKIYTVTVTPDPANGGTVSGGGTYYEGETVTLIATPRSGYVFTGWYRTSHRVSTEATYSFNADGDVTLRAFFDESSSIPDHYTVTAVATPPGAGTVAGSGDYANGTTATLIATPNPGYKFVEWYYIGQGIGHPHVTVSTKATITVDTGRTYYAEFEKDTAPDDPGDPGDPGTTPAQPESVCPWCGGQHVGFFQGIIGFFHGIFAKIFGARY